MTPLRYTMMSSSDATRPKAATPKAMSTQTPLRDIRKRKIDRPPPLRKRTLSAPARMNTRRRKRHLLVEDHYRVDAEDKSLLPGPIKYEDDWARDLHDFFNLISLVPVVVLNVLNWDWDILLDLQSKKTLQQAWTGEWFPLFYAITIGYFFADLIWVIMVPDCVKSPGVIIQHHIATLFYLIIPYRFPEEGWLMGACLCVEVNTWLLIARRVFNKHGFVPWTFDFRCISIRVKLISVLFYVTWIAIRCWIYPSILVILWRLWFEQWERGFVFKTRYSVALVLHFIFCILNFKWTFDLFRGKWRALRSGKAAKVEKGL